MTQEEKELLLKDLCGRLPYGVKVELHEDVCTLLGYFNEFVMLTANVPTGQQTNISNIKLYLRPMSSMTEEEREDFWWNVLDMDWKEDLDYDDDNELETVPFPFVENGCGFYLDNYYLKDTFAVIEWLNKHHFDYHGLIEKGLALEAPKDMYK